MRDGRFFLGDLGSTNGTFVGEFPSSASRQVVKGKEEEVSDGQLILFGDVECTLSI
jgi:pSer/pThr/pTyr-binding forkhead associated (FHA) protein